MLLWKMNNSVQKHKISYQKNYFCIIFLSKIYLWDQNFKVMLLDKNIFQKLFSIKKQNKKQNWDKIQKSNKLKK